MTASCFDRGILLDFEHGQGSPGRKREEQAFMTSMAHDSTMSRILYCSQKIPPLLHISLSCDVTDVNV